MAARSRRVRESGGEHSLHMRDRWIPRGRGASFVSDVRSFRAARSGGIPEGRDTKARACRPRGRCGRCSVRAASRPSSWGRRGVSYGPTDVSLRDGGGGRGGGHGAGRPARGARVPRRAERGRVRERDARRERAGDLEPRVPRRDVVHPAADGGVQLQGDARGAGGARGHRREREHRRGPELLRRRDGLPERHPGDDLPGRPRQQPQRREDPLHPRVARRPDRRHLHGRRQLAAVRRRVVPSVGRVHRGAGGVV